MKAINAMKLLNKFKWSIIGIFLGAVGGYLYYFYVGCESGTCAITSKPLNSTLYGAMMGGLLFNSFEGKDKKTKEENSEIKTQ
jgi:phage shock protein E